MSTAMLPKAIINLWTLIFYNKATIFQTENSCATNLSLLLGLPICYRYPCWLCIEREEFTHLIWFGVYSISLSSLTIVFINVTKNSLWGNSFYFLFYFTILYWFCHTLTWIRHGCIWVPNPELPLPTPLSPSLWVIPVHQPHMTHIILTHIYGI